MCEATLRVAALTILPWLSLISAAATAQISPVSPSETAHRVVEAFTLEHQPAGEALEIVRSILSPMGRVEVQGDSNTLVVRDRVDFVDKARKALSRYDHPSRDISFTIRLVEASASPEPSEIPLPPHLVSKMKRMLRYEHFEERGHAEVVGREGQHVGYQIGADFRVGFRVGTVLENRRLKLHDFQVYRIGEHHKATPLIHTQLVIRLGQTLIFGLARSEESGEALMVVLQTVPNVVSPPAIPSRRDDPGQG